MGWSSKELALAKDSLSIGYSTEGSFISVATQTGIEDTPKTVEFGVGGLTDNGHINVASNGEVEVLSSGYYSIKQRFRTSRAGASGVSDIFFWVEASVDGGTVWNTFGNSVDIALDSSNETTVFFDLSNIHLDAGIKLRNRFARSSTGDNSGDLTSATPSAALITAGAPTAPSAQITIYRIQN